MTQEHQRAAGKLGAKAMLEKYGIHKLLQKVQAHRRLNRSVPERKVEDILRMINAPPWEPEYIFEERFLLDFAWPGRRFAIEIDGAVHRIAACDPDGKKAARGERKREALGAAGWVLLTISDESLDNVESLIELLNEWVVPDVLEQPCIS